MRNYLADFNLFAVSANAKETALNTEQTLDTGLLVPKSTVLQLDPNRQTNENEATGKEEPDKIYDFGSLSIGTLSFEKAGPQHFAFLYAYGLGTVTSSDWGTGRKHLITPQAGIALPSMTGAMKLGATLLKRRFASLFVDTLKSTFAKDSWLKVEGGLKGTGKYTDNVYSETVNAAYNGVSLTLDANAVEGADAASRLDSVHQVRVNVPSTNEWKEVVFTAVSGATPAVLTIEAPGETADLVDYEILYVPDEPAWCTLSAYVTEPPLRISQIALKLGGKWNGSAFLGGRTLSTEIDSIEHNLNNQMLIEQRPGGSGGEYANYAVRQGRQQTLSLNREMREAILQQKIKDNEYFGVYIKATGAEFETGKNYYAELVFPRCGVLKAPVTVNGTYIAEAGDLSVLQDDTYGSVRVEVANLVENYAA
jgi:hypothetical protein